MQDRFKTRFFDKVTQVIYTLKSIVNTCENRKDITFYGILVSGIGQISEHELDNEYSTRFIRMQCTGLKDKNGKLIYEGDIVYKKGNNFNGKKILSEIIWSNMTASFQYSDLSGIGGMHDFRSGTIKKMEIVGNIYENPELMRSC